jgi:hypothetical protein
LKPGEVAATDAAATVDPADFATGRFARPCTANASGDTGGFAAAVCAKAFEGTRLLITIVALAIMNSFVEEEMRDRSAVTFRSLPKGKDPLNTGTIVELL